MKVYVVQEGSEYEDSFIIGVCSTLNTAIKVVKTRIDEKIEDEWMPIGVLKRGKIKIEQHPYQTIWFEDTWIEITEYEVKS